MPMFRSGVFVVLLAIVVPARAIEPGLASGSYTRGDVHIEFSHAIALDQDNAEGMPDSDDRTYSARRIRLLLSDKNVPASLIYGFEFPQAWAAAGNGEVRGLLLEFDPADRTVGNATLLTPALTSTVFTDDPEQSPTSRLSNSNGVWTRMTATALHVEGELRSNDALGDIKLSFSAPLLTDPIEAILKDKEAWDSIQVRVWATYMQAVARNDRNAALALLPRQGQMRVVSPAIRERQVVDAPAAPKVLSRVERVVVRRNTAIVRLPPGQGWFELVREDGAWKVVD